MGDIDTRELETRLGYWIHHNREHGDEFKEWASKAGEAGMSSVEANLSRASELMEQATATLEGALQSLKPS